MIICAYTAYTGSMRIINQGGRYVLFVQRAFGGCQPHGAHGTGTGRAAGLPRGGHRAFFACHAALRQGSRRRLFAPQAGHRRSAAKQCCFTATIGSALPPAQKRPCLRKPQGAGICGAGGARRQPPQGGKRASALRHAGGCLLHRQRVAGSPWGGGRTGSAGMPPAQRADGSARSAPDERPAQQPPQRQIRARPDPPCAGRAAGPGTVPGR